MLFSNKCLREIAGRFLSILERERINSMSDLEKFAGRKFYADYPVEEFVDIKFNPPNNYNVIYARPVLENFPEEAIIISLNRQTGYTKICTHTLCSRESFVFNEYEVLVESMKYNFYRKNIESADFRRIKEEIKKLMSFKD